MERGPASVPDWRDAAAYAPLLAADRMILAWEWLRRDRGYRLAAAGADHGSPTAAHAWGLHRFEDPRRAAPAARPLWTADAFDGVLTATAAPGAAVALMAPTRVNAAAGALGSGPRRLHGDPGFDLRPLAGWLTVAGDGAGGEHLLLSDGLRAIRCDLSGAAVGDGPLHLAFLVPGPPRLVAPLAALRAFDALARTGGFVSAFHPPVTRARRQVLVLRTADALAAGAGQRAIAAAVLDPAAARPGWREDRPDLRQQAQRLVRDARAQAGGGFRRLLRAR